MRLGFDFLFTRDDGSLNKPEGKPNELVPEDLQHSDRYFGERAIRNIMQRFVRPIKTRRERRRAKRVRSKPYLIALRSRALSAIKYADDLDVMLSKFLNEAIPTQDVPVFMRHRREMKALCDERAIAGNTSQIGLKQADDTTHITIRL